LIPMLGTVIVTYHSSTHIGACLESLSAELKELKESTLIYIVDNASSDRTLSIVREQFEPIHILENDRNLGFATAVNRGIRQALAAGCAEILLLNPDTEMETGSLKSMVDMMRSQTASPVPVGAGHVLPLRVLPLRVLPLRVLPLRVGIVQPLITLMSDPGLINTSGNIDRGFGLVTLGNYRRQVESWWDAMGPGATGAPSYPIPFASGACMLIRREVFEDIGLFDEDYFLYFEDSEFSRRARRAGWQIELVPAARVRHDYRPLRSLRKLKQFFSSWRRFVK